MRVPHFVGLHAIQVLAIVAVACGAGGGPRRCASGSSRLPRRVTRALSCCCSGRRCGDTASWRPMRPSLAAFAVWAAITVLALWLDHLPLAAAPRQRLGSDDSYDAERLFSIAQPARARRWLPLVFLPSARWGRR